MPVRGPRAAVVFAGLLLLGACSNAGEDLSFGPGPGRAVTLVVFYDRDASGTFTAFDTTFPGIRAGLVTLGTQDTVAAGTSDAQGRIQIASMPLGRYRLAVDTTGLGDTLRLFAAIPDTLVVTASTPAQAVSGALTLPRRTASQVRAAADGERVMVSGVVLSGLQRFADTTAHLRDATGALRLLDARNLGAPPFNIEGDSVRVLGTVATRNGQKVIAQARLFTYYAFAGGTGPRVDTLSTASARTAAGGSRDADLVFINSAAILSATPVGSALQVTVDDASGPVDLLLDENLGAVPGQFPVGMSVRAQGVLVPTGTGFWQLKPRALGAGGDVVVF